MRYRKPAPFVAIVGASRNETDASSRSRSPLSVKKRTDANTLVSLCLSACRLAKNESETKKGDQCNVDSVQKFLRLELGVFCSWGKWGEKAIRGAVIAGGCRAYHGRVSDEER